jgi:hypothetical protein
MFFRRGWANSVFPVLLGTVTLASVGALFVWDAFPGLLPARTHEILAAFSLATIALAYLVYQTSRRPAGTELAKSILLAAAFLFWAANQYWPNLRVATLFNDIAIALFVLDIFLVIAGRPVAPTERSFDRSRPESGKDRQIYPCPLVKCGAACCPRGKAG